MSRYFTKQSVLNEREVTDAIRERAYRLHDMSDLDPLFRLIGDSRIVMLGEATHARYIPFWCLNNFLKNDHHG